MPMGQLPGRMAELDRSTPLYVICASGARSEAMTDVLPRRRLRRAHGRRRGQGLDSVWTSR